MKAPHGAADDGDIGFARVSGTARDTETEAFRTVEEPLLLLLLLDGDVPQWFRVGPAGAPRACGGSHPERTGPPARGCMGIAAFPGEWDVRSTRFVRST